ncbi:Translation release factor [Komagataella phaffii CBS 7435]|uniref:Peptide chain release factor 1, mitochondrial n=2 Tax=Komagataella phaffii TaxID=460519 RepID=C4R6E5_KOMPG|nr:uncharacterized protein PAS_chr3_1249 [Komagataella phaffii GS115]AOA64100.1 GQ67_04200T0 [Komagataella phaffii]CAH2449028.1 Translation release factor [Komagataella phaffii CBS 7435]AOA69414.1 GQ68_04173T0 [Komagataella phaffii GS115]CAY71131.1 hypothetical protein PAS_chr3_1249 [Komagataella phaffii GS115]CCA39071.1 Translation release factor [Komagataella phaffii CBS 7435]
MLGRCLIRNSQYLLGAKSLLTYCRPLSDKSYVATESISPTLLKKASRLSSQLKDLESKLSSSDEFSYQDSRDYSLLVSTVETYNEFLRETENVEELQRMLHEDPSLKEEIESELTQAAPKLKRLTSKLKTKLLPPHEFADKPCILELRPGIGGSEANLFTEDLLSMYEKYAQHHRWSYEIISRNPHPSGNGLVDAAIVINEPGSYNRLRFEAGVHRVQRVPATESKGRTHTSTAAVVVLPKIDEDDTSLNRTFLPDDIRIDVMRASGSGGQHVNTTESAVRVTHIPSGIVVLIQDERSQHKNKAKALTILKARLAEKERVEKEEKELAERKGQVSSTDRSDKIRTYNFSQNRITDHRCGYSLHNVEGCLNGYKLDEIIDALLDKETAEKSDELVKQLETKEGILN